MRSNLWIIAALCSTSLASAGETWPQFRGPGGDGHSDATGLPLTWSETQNVAWKTAIHDRGWSSPVIWGDQIWMTTATVDGKEMFAVCVDRRTGQIRHDLKVFDVDHPQHVATVNSYASPTPVIEPGRVYVHFGTYGTACLDTETGKTLWTRRDLNCDHHEGPGASPLLLGDLLIFHVDGCDVQYVIALDKATGQTVWKTDRSIDFSRVHPFLRKAFCTPIVIRVDGRPQLISPGAKAVMAYEPNTGEELWKLRYRGWSVTPRPLFGRGLLFLVMDYEHPEIWAVRPGGRGDLPEDHVVWRMTRAAPKQPSFLLVGRRIYAVNDEGILSCLEAETGRVVWRERIEGDYSASPIYADGRLYFFSRDCLATVVEPAAECRVLAANRLDGRMMASPAVAGKALFVRTETHLYRIEKRD